MARKKGSKKKVIYEIARIKHSKVIKDVLENGKTLEQAKLAVGYSKSYAKKGHAKDTRTWKELLAEFLPDDELLIEHKRLLHKGEKFSTKDEGIVQTGEPHSDVAKALDMAYKLKNTYGATTIKHEFGELSDDDIEKETAEIISEAESLAHGEETTDRE